MGSFGGNELETYPNCHIQNPVWITYLLINPDCQTQNLLKIELFKWKLFNVFVYKWVEQLFYFLKWKIDFFQVKKKTGRFIAWIQIHFRMAVERFIMSAFSMLLLLYLIENTHACLHSFSPFFSLLFILALLVCHQTQTFAYPHLHTSARYHLVMESYSWTVSLNDTITPTDLFDKLNSTELNNEIQIEFNHQRNQWWFGKKDDIDDWVTLAREQHAINYS